jgi:adenosine deaminase
MASSLTLAGAISRPKVVLHDHLDGGVRPSTLIELAARAGYTGLASDDPGVVAERLHAGARAGSLEHYLQGFSHTVAATQSAAALGRMAAEAAADLAADGVVHAEVRFAPELHAGAGTLDDAVYAVTRGLERGARHSGLSVGLILCAMRTGTRTADVVSCATRWQRDGVVGVDLAGDELAGPVGPHTEALTGAVEAGLGLTVHAGEAAGLDSIAGALDAGAHRIGHGVRLVDDIVFGSDGSPRPGELCQRVIEAGVVLELCPSSNVHTAVVGSIAAHPIDLLRAVGVGVTVNPDNRLMSATSASGEFAALGTHLGWSADDLDATTDTALNAAFLTDERWAVLHAEIAALRRTVDDRRAEAGFPRA